MTVEATVAARLADVRARIAASGGPPDIAVVAVTKGFGAEAVAAAAAAGCAAIGENYAQELLAKHAAVEAAGVAVHFIGRLQSNKVRVLAGRVDLWESVDRAPLVDELARRAPGARVLVQVDANEDATTAGDVGQAGAGSKGGCRPDEVPRLVARAWRAGLAVEGLMAVGPTTGGPEAARPAFRTVRRLVDELGLAVASMGMSADLEVAIEEGSTEVRLGTALFGPRSGN